VAFLSRNGRVTDYLGNFGKESWAEAINNRGQIVGRSSFNEVVQRLHAYIWENGVMTDLNDLVPADLGWEIGEADDINDTGWIVASDTGRLHPVLLIPEPATRITTPAMDLQDGPPLEMAIVGPSGDGEVGGLYGIWLRGDGVGGDPDYRWSISGGPELLPDTLLVELPDTDLDGTVDDYFLTFAHLAEAGARDRDATAPYTLRLEALDNGGIPIAGSESEILLLVPEPAALSLLALGGLALLRRQKRGVCR